MNDHFIPEQTIDDKKRTWLEDVQIAIDQLKAMDWNHVTDAMREEAQGVIKSLTASVYWLEAASDQLLTDEERALQPEVQRLWALYAQARGRKPDAEVAYVEHIGRYQADGIALGETYAETFTWLRAQTAGTE